jgi:Sec-independent protein translocase protein TatA
MEILGIGPLEFLLIILVALIVLGPRDMAKAVRTLGRLLRKIVTSPEWRTAQRASKELSLLPTKLIREAGLEEAQKDIGQIGGQIQQDFKQWKGNISSWTTPPDQSEISSPPPILPDNQTTSTSPNDPPSDKKQS